MSMSASRPLARSTTLPDFDRPFGLNAFDTIEAALRAHTADDALYVLYPDRIAAAAQKFLAEFPGKSLYAIKANPHPAVLSTLIASGLRAFDVASIREIDAVRSLSPSAELYLMNPVKSRATIRHAYAKGVRDFAFDCRNELLKILRETDGADDLNLHIRVSLPPSGAVMPLDGKFGADRETVIALLNEARPVAAKLGVCFHVGSQCMDPQDYVKALGYVRELVDEAGVDIDSLDCGGGFPVAYPGLKPVALSAYFTAIAEGITRFGFSDLNILGEPGRALCAMAGTTLTRVELRKGNDLYLNDGAYGSLFDAAKFGWKYPVKAHRLAGKVLSADAATFRFYGPTCDSIDVIEGPFELPQDIDEGDWIEIGHLGAYGQVLATGFNGFQSETTVAVFD